MKVHVDFIRTTKIDDFKKHHPPERAYDMPFLAGDRVGQIAYFEIIDWIVKVQITKIENGTTYFKRIEKMSFEE